MLSYIISNPIDTVIHLVIILIFIFTLCDVDKIVDDPKKQRTSLSESEKEKIKSSPKWFGMIVLTCFFPLISCIKYKRWGMFAICIFEWFIIFTCLDISWELWLYDDPFLIVLIACITIRIMTLNKIIWVNYNAGYFCEQSENDIYKKKKNKSKSNNTNKILILLLLCCTALITITWCSITWDSFWCYLENWALNKHPLRDNEWNIVNCYNNIWKQNWKWLYYDESWWISGVENFKDWELNGKRISYFDNWQIEDEGFYISWFNYNWERIRYYYDWKIRYVWYYKNWKEDWKWVSYYKNWKINYVWYYKNWEQDWERVSYNEDWEIDWKIIFSGWIIVNNDIENTDIIHFGVDNFFEENLTKRMLCYTSYGYPNFVPERNEDWDIINCYDRSWNMNGKWVIDIDTSVIDGVESIWKVKMEGNFLNWKENWKMKYYYENWNIQLEIMYINWIEEWLRKSYYENGQTKSKWNNKNWEKSWKETTYYQNGQVESEIMFKNWKQDWESKLYNESWQTMLVWNFKNWVKDGNRIYYYDNWIVKFEENYKNWKLNGDVVLYNENWEVDTKAFYKNWNRIK